MKTYKVFLIERTEHSLEVEAESLDDAVTKAQQGWRDGDLCDDNPVLIDLSPSSVREA